MQLAHSRFAKNWFLWVNILIGRKKKKTQYIRNLEMPELSHSHRISLRIFNESQQQQQQNDERE